MPIISSTVAVDDWCILILAVACYIIIGGFDPLFSQDIIHLKRSTIVKINSCVV